MQRMTIPMITDMIIPTTITPVAGTITRTIILTTGMATMGMTTITGISDSAITTPMLRRISAWRSPSA